MILRLPDGSFYVAHFEHHGEFRARSTVCHLHDGACRIVPATHCGTPCTLCRRRSAGREQACSLRQRWGIASCSPRDQFVKSVGRKLALSRAMRAGLEPFGRDTRRAIWRAYFAATDRMPVPKARA